MIRVIKKHFNMVEVTLAIAVVGIGIAGIMSLFPVGFQATRDAIGDNYCADVANQFMTYMTLECQRNTDWKAENKDFGDAGETSSGMPKVLLDDKPDKDGSQEASETDANWTEVASGSNIKQAQTVADKAGLFRITQGNSTITDFNATVRVWRSKIYDIYVGGAKPPDGIPEGFAVILNIEISWPVGKPYPKREKRIYQLEIFNKN